MVKGHILDLAPLAVTHHRVLTSSIKEFDVVSSKLIAVSLALVTTLGMIAPQAHRAHATVHKNSKTNSRSLSSNLNRRLAAVVADTPASMAVQSMTANDLQALAVPALQRLPFSSMSAGQLAVVAQLLSNEVDKQTQQATAFSNFASTVSDQAAQDKIALNGCKAMSAFQSIATADSALIGKDNVGQRDTATLVVSAIPIATALFGCKSDKSTNTKPNFTNTTGGTPKS